MFHQNNGTAMGTKLAPPYACLSIGFLEETILFPKILPQYFSPQVCAHIENKYKRYMDDGFLSLPGTIDISTFLSCMNSQHPDIKFTTKTATISQSTTGDYYQSLDFLDILVILHSNGKIETEIFYKITNAHDYLEFNSQHPFHILKNIPYNLAKRIIIFTSDDKKTTKHLNDLKDWLINCNYPPDIIERSFHNAHLQGPAPCPTTKNHVIPFVSTNFANLNLSHMRNNIQEIISNSKDDHLKKVFKDTKIVLGLRQPNSLLRHLTRSKFSNLSPTEPRKGLTKCTDKRCLIC